MILKVFEIDPSTCPKWGAMMKIIAFLTDTAVVNRNINHLNLTFIASKPPPPHRVSRDSSWTPRLRPIIFHNLSFDQKEMSP